MDCMTQNIPVTIHEINALSTTKQLKEIKT